MSTTVSKPKLFLLGDTLTLGTMCVVATLLAIGASLTKQDQPVPVAGWAILWAVVIGFWGIAAVFYAARWKHISDLRYVVSPPGFWVGWHDGRYAVSPSDIQAEYELLLRQMLPQYPKAAEALAECQVWFREPVWVTDTEPGTASRKVAGLQQGRFLQVGWHADLHTSGFRHELAHVVIQASFSPANCPLSEAEQHKIMATMDCC